MTAGAARYRIVYRHEPDDRSFKVQQDLNPGTGIGVPNWRTVGRFRNLRAASNKYPAAVPDSTAILKQALRDAPHGFEADLNRDTCAWCGHPRGESQQLHAGGAR